jgi:Arc/MetJ family transcription regulator
MRSNIHITDLILCKALQVVRNDYESKRVLRELRRFTVDLVTLFGDSPHTRS